MSSAFEKIRIKCASGRKNLIDLSHEHITTQDFGVNKCVMCKEMIPGDTFDANIGTFVRLAPMTLPTYANVRLYLRGYFVPFRVLMNGFYNMLTQTPYHNGSQSYTPAIPTVSNDMIVDCFIDTYVPEVGLTYVVGGSSDACDFQIGNTKYNFTLPGRYFYDLLLSLGYSINWSKSDTTIMSAMPLLAFAKIYRDYLVPSQYQSTFDTQFEGYFTLIGKTFTGADLYKFSKIMISIYEPDFFTSAYQSPNAPNNNQVDSSQLTSPVTGVPGQTSDQNIRIMNNKSDVSIVSSVNNNYSTLSSYALELAERLTAFIRRNAHVGSRWIDQSLARFGVRPSDAKLLRSELIGSSMLNVQISDVMATAAGTNEDGQTSEVGDYAGKGIGYGSGHFHYESNEFGYFIITSALVPNVGYYQGRSPEVLRRQRLDFFTPEFDSVGMDPIRNDYLFADYRSSDDYTSGLSYGGDPSKTFGFCPRYSNYKFSNDVVSGMFRCNSMNVGLEAYHLKRILPSPSGENPLTCGPQFAVMDDRYQYDRIFSSDTSGNTDHFFTIYHIDLKCKRPMISVVDHLDVEGAGNTLDMAHYGVQV